MSAEQTSPTKCPLCGASLKPLAMTCPACGENFAPLKYSEPRPLWQKILIAVAIIIGVQWALVVLLFAVCLISYG